MEYNICIKYMNRILKKYLTKRNVFLIVLAGLVIWGFLGTFKEGHEGHGGGAARA